MEPLSDLLIHDSLGEQLKKRASRFPKFYDSNLAKPLHSLLTHVEPDFFEKRSPPHLIRLISTHYYLRKRLIQISPQPIHQILLKCFPSNLQQKKVLSLAFAVHLSHPSEIPEEKQLSLALSRFLPGIKIIPDSFYSHLEKSSLLLFCYLEIEKPWGNKIASEQIRLLQQKLPGELLQCIQSLTPSLLIPYNQEEIYKNIVQLAKELHSTRDLPQVVITSQAQSRELLCFQIIAVRVKKKSPLRFDRLSSSIRLHSQKIIPLRSSSKLQKEALVFQLEIDSHLFLRRNWTIDLRRARSCVVKTLEQLLGSFRDYNGGLFYQQDRQFEEISKNLKRNDELLYPFEELFYAFNPSFQPIIPIRTATLLFSLFADILKKELPPEGFLIARKKQKEDTLLILKTSSSKICDQFLKQIKNQFRQDDSSLGVGSIEYKGMYYVCMADLNSLHLNTLEQIVEQFIQAKNPDKPLERKILRINFQEGDPPSLNPHLAGDTRSRSLGKSLFEGLTRLNPKGVPQLAASYKVEISPCQMIYTFHLREHHWSNGKLVTAYDFEHAWKKALSPDSDCLCADLFYIIKNAKTVKQGRGSTKEVKIKALNAKTLQVKLEHPTPYFLHLIAHSAFSPLYKGEEEPIHFNGPFIVKKWQHDHCLHLTGNPYYWDKKNVPLQEIFISMVKDIRAVSEMFNRGELDWIGDPFSHLPLQDISSCQVNTPLHIKKANRIYWICLNTLSFPLQSAKIRKALSFAINRKEIAHQLFDGYLPLLSPIPNTKSKKILMPDGNVPLAQQLFKEGLGELNLTYETFPEITLNYSDRPGQKLLAKMVKKQIEAALKIRLNLVETHWNALSDLVDKKDYQLVGYFKSPPYFYPSSRSEVFRERLQPVDASGWENRAYFSLLDQANKTSDPKVRRQLLKKAEEILLEEMPVIPLFQQAYKCLVHPNIKKIHVHQNGDVDLKFTLL